MRNKLIAIVLAAALTVPLAFPTAAADGSSQNKEPSQSNLTLNKTVSYNITDNSYTVNLESYATGDVITSQTSVPTDFILVLDQSGSMSYRMDGVPAGEDMSNYWMKNHSNSFFDYGWEDYAYSNSLFFKPTGTTTYYPITLDDPQKNYNNYWYSFTDDNGVKHPVNAQKSNNKFSLTQLFNDNGIEGKVTTGILEKFDSRLDILKTTAKSFVNQVAESGNDNRAAIVGFDSYGEVFDGSDCYHYYDEKPNYLYLHNWRYDLNSTITNCVKSIKNVSNDAGKNAVNSSVDALKADGATNAQDGMILAKDVCNEIKNDGRNKVVIFLTDGVPTTGSDFNENTAKGAIAASKVLKETLNAKVYSIGIFNGADPTSCLPYNKNLSEDQKANIFMNLVSSNYPNAAAMDNTGTKALNSNYYLTASTQEGMQNVFEQIRKETCSPTTTLDSTAVVKDVVSQYFKLPDNVKKSDISVSTVKCTGKQDGKFVFDNSTKTALTGADISIASNTVSVSGFDYKNTFCSQTARTVNSSSYYGEKLVISFKIQPKAEFMGGNDVPTNDYVLKGGAVKDCKLSGIYEKADAAAPLQNFNQPTVNVNINPQYKDIAMNVYAGNALPHFGEYVDATISNSSKWTCDYVKLDGYGTTDSEMDTLSNHDIHFTQYVSPKISKDDTVSGIGPKQDKVSQDLKCALTVFHPIIPCSDSTIFLGETAKAYLGNNIWNDKDKINWKHGETSSADNGVVMIGSEPTLTFDYDISPSDFDDDTPIDVKSVKNGNTEIVSLAEFTNSAPKPQGKEFTVHVKSGTLNLAKTFTDNKFYNDPNETFVFRIVGVGGSDKAKAVDMQVVVSKDKLKATITHLPKGTYKITEDTAWSWRYSPVTSSINTQEINEQNPNASISFENKLNDETWLNGFAKVSNEFKETGEVH